MNQNHNPFVSIICPVFNSEQTLQRAIDSVWKQSFEDWELILINDGSTDNSGLICELAKMKDYRISVLNQCNQGVSCARNRGLEVSRGQWIAFLDSDDWVDSDWLKYYFDEIHQSDSDLIFQGFVVHDGMTEFRKVIHVDRDGQQLLRTIQDLELNNVFGYTWVKLYRGELIRNHGLKFQSGVNLCEDYLFTLQYCQIGTSISAVDKCGYHYMIGPNSLTNLSNSFCSCDEVSKILLNEKYKLAKKYNDKEYASFSKTLYFSDKIGMIFQLYKHPEKVNSDFRKKQIRSISASDCSNCRRGSMDNCFRIMKRFHVPAALMDFIIMVLVQSFKK